MLKDLNPWLINVAFLVIAAMVQLLIVGVIDKFAVEDPCGGPKDMYWPYWIWLTMIPAICAGNLYFYVIVSCLAVIMQRCGISSFLAYFLLLLVALFVGASLFLPGIIAVINEDPARLISHIPHSFVCTVLVFLWFFPPLLAAFLAVRTAYRGQQ